MFQWHCFFQLGILAPVAFRIGARSVHFAVAVMANCDSVSDWHAASGAHAPRVAVARRTYEGDSQGIGDDLSDVSSRCNVDTTEGTSLSPTEPFKYIPPAAADLEEAALRQYEWHRMVRADRLQHWCEAGFHSPTTTVSLAFSPRMCNSPLTHTAPERDSVNHASEGGVGETGAPSTAHGGQNEPGHAYPAWLPGDRNNSCQCATLFRIAARATQLNMVGRLFEQGLIYFLGHSRSVDLLSPQENITLQGICRAAVALVCPRCVAVAWLHHEEHQPHVGQDSGSFSRLWHAFLASRLVRRSLKNLTTRPDMSVVILGSRALVKFLHDARIECEWVNNDIDVYVRCDGNGPIDEIARSYIINVLQALRLDGSSDVHEFYGDDDSVDDIDSDPSDSLYTADDHSSGSPLGDLADIGDGHAFQLGTPHQRADVATVRWAAFTLDVVRVEIAKMLCEEEFATGVGDRRRCLQETLANLPPALRKPAYQVDRAVMVKPHARHAQRARQLGVQPLNIVKVSIPQGRIMSGALICGSYDMAQCAFEITVTDELRFEVRGHGDAVECAQRQEIRFNDTAFYPLRPNETVRTVVRRQMGRVHKYMLDRGFAFNNRGSE